MSDRYFVDTNILMYAHHIAAGGKHERAQALVQDLWLDCCNPPCAQHRTVAGRARL